MAAGTKSSTSLELRNYRWRVASRTLAALLGAFALTSAVSILLAMLLVRSGFTTRGPAVHGATLIGFLVWCAAVMWSFNTISVRQVWWQLLTPAAACGLLAWALGWAS